jgi:GT2 family glycosyltransferase
MAAADIVISTRGRGALIVDTVASIRQSNFQDLALWIVDQSADDATERAIAPHVAQDARVHYVRSASQGADIGRNLGVACGSAPYLLLTDDDCRVEPDWLGAMLDELQMDGTWAVFGRITPDEAYESEKARTAALPSQKPVTRALPLALKDDASRRVYEKNRLNLGFGHGANMGMRRARFEELGGLDELLGVGAPLRSWPERDLGYRILRRGGRIVYTPEARVYHRHWRDWESLRRTYRNYAIGAGAAAGKYLRCGEVAGLYLLLEWFVDQGLRQVISGALKWRSRQKVETGLLQLVYPWVGLYLGRRYSVDRERVLYRQG